MKTPQVEDGYTRIANELLEAILRFDFSKREQKIVLAVIRKTYGFGKTSDDISLSQLAEMTGITPAHCSETIKGLSDKGVFLIREGRHGKHIGLSKDYRNWKRTGRGSQNGNIPKTGQKGSQNGTKPIPKTGTTKENSKEIQKKGESTLPLWVNQTAWQEFEQHRRDIRKPLTELARKKNLSVLQNLNAEEQQRSVDQTIANRWTGLFPPKDNHATRQQGNSAIDRVRAAHSKREHDGIVLDADDRNLRA